jgi:DnaK suppressor protein
MALQIRRRVSDIDTEKEITTGTGTTWQGPAGAPKVSHVKEVLLTLRSRLGLQLESQDDNDPSLARALRDNIRGQIEQINEALTRIEQGKYGVCANCLATIEGERLVVRPYSTLCLSCQNRQDRGMLAHSYK